ncbi:MarR family winged helix-turn-helix transcriptional regulator [Paludibacterium yongneupense]|uniref:MarR family winged helix-turn-helix transcriptional regulator n=1 Tax=Paludibacterium yongneupense TaxID=400061 RepID=UPI000423A5E3|nr:MarR family transcriptional regulator [Paludibacterium yongneupense]
MNDYLQLDQQLCFALYAASRAMTQAYQPLLGPLELTYPQYLVMLVLWEHDGLNVKELGERLLLDSGTLTPLLKRLETAGLIERRRSQQDERQVCIRLTDDGRERREMARSIPLAMAARIGCETQDIAGLRETLMQLIARLR